MKDETLLPCPFCGTQPQFVPMLGVWCNNDNCSIVGTVFSGGPRHWNKRDSPAQPVTVPDGLRLALSNAGIAAPESDEMLFATHEKYVQFLVDWVKDRKPFAVPDGYVLVSAEFIDTVNQAFKEVGDRKSFPGHSHDIPGVWDNDNGEKANKPCAQCAMWSKLHDMLASAPAVSDGWIPVSERMPEFNDEVLAWHRHGYSLIAVYSTSKDPITYKTYRCLVDNKGHEIDATHWQPLPDAPKVKP